MNFIAKFFLPLTLISGTFCLDSKFDPRYENEWTEACKDGKLQSPVAAPNLCGRSLLKRINIEYTNMRVPVKEVKVTNSVRQTVFEWNRSVERSVVIRTSSHVRPFLPDTPYILQNFHVHHSMNEQSGTLHSIGGSFFAAEGHFLFVRKEFDNNVTAGFVALGNTLEIAVMYKLSKIHNPAWAALNNLKRSKKLSEGEKITSDLSIDLSDLIPKSSTYSMYQGSVPSSGCPEVITWIIYDVPVEFDVEKLAMREWTYISDGKEVAVTRNVRRIQSLNDRPVCHGQSEIVTHCDDKKPREPAKPTKPDAGHGNYE